MKKTIQAAALILLAATAVYAAAHSQSNVHEKCTREWENIQVSKVKKENVQLLYSWQELTYSLVISVE